MVKQVMLLCIYAVIAALKSSECPRKFFTDRSLRSLRFSRRHPLTKRKKRTSMTIQINRDAVLYVLSQPPQPGQSPPTAYQCHYHAPHLQPYDDEAEIEVNPGKNEPVIRLVSVSAHNASSVPRPQSKPDVREAPIEAPRRVQFADELVSDVWTRPRTPPGDLRALFYSSEETQR